MPLIGTMEKETTPLQTSHTPDTLVNETRATLSALRDIIGWFYGWFVEQIQEGARARDMSWVENCVEATKSLDQFDNLLTAIERSFVENILVNKLGLPSGETAAVSADKDTYSSEVPVNDARAHLTALGEIVAKANDLMVERMQALAVSRDMDGVKRCVDDVRFLEKVVEGLPLVEDDLVDILQYNADFREQNWNEKSTTGLRTIMITVSQGMINQNLLTLSSAKAEGIVEIGEKFKVLLPDGTKFETDLCEPGNKLRERGLIRRFYRAAEVEDGDQVVLIETSPGSWKLLADSSPEWKTISAAGLGETKQERLRAWQAFYDALQVTLPQKSAGQAATATKNKEK
jgi:hypothetical protein